MRRILPILVSLIGFYSISTFAVPFTTAEPKCDGDGSLPGQVCAKTAFLVCGKGKKNCDIQVTSPADTMMMLTTCDRDLKAAQAACQGNDDKLKIPTGGGTRDACVKLKDGLEKAVTANEDFAATCRAKVAACEARCGTYSKSFSGPLGGGGASMLPGGADPAAQITGMYKACTGLLSKAESSETSVKTDIKGTLVAASCEKEAEEKLPGKDGAGGGGKDSPGGGGKTDATKPGSGGSNPMASMFNPQSMMQMLQAMNKKDDETPEEEQFGQMQDCTALPTLAGCQTATLQPQSWNQQTGESGTSKDAESTGFASNPTDIGGAQPASVGPTGQVGTPPTYQGIANGGGQMLGGGGGGSPASLGGGSGGGAGGAGGKKVEITTGGGGGGFSQQAANMKMTNGEGGGGYNYGGRNPSGVDNGFNLSEFLPGGAKDPFKGRAIAGQMNGTGNFQIQSKDVNLFSRISERIKSRCAQGLLRDCIP